MIPAYVFQADLHCEKCTDIIKLESERDGYKPDDPDDEYTYDSDTWPKGPCCDMASDCPQHCGTCGLFLETPLTPDGEDYVLEQAIDGPILAEWREHYSYLWD